MVVVVCKGMNGSFGLSLCLAALGMGLPYR